MSEPRREEIAPVFAEFGSACHQAQLLEDAIRLLLLLGRAYAATQIPDSSLRYPVEPENIKTLGALLRELFKVEVVSEQDNRSLWQAVKTRNWLMHDYWSATFHPRSAELFMTPGGRRELIEELREVRHRLRKATRIVHSLTDQYLALHGLSMQQFMDRTAAIYVSERDEADFKDLIQ